MLPARSDLYRYNFWGYSTLNYMSPMSRFSFAVSHGANAQVATAGSGVAGAGGERARPPAAAAPAGSPRLLIAS